jgi:predicted secreted Zn-dependent protease
MAWWKTPGYLTLCCSFTASLLLMESPQANIAAGSGHWAAECGTPQPCADNSPAETLAQRDAARRETIPANNQPVDVARLENLTETSSRQTVEEYQESERVGDFDIRSTYRDHYFSISASSSREIWQQLRGDSNPIGHTTASGTKPLAFSSWNYRYSYNVAFGTNETSCSISSGRIEFEFNTTLPRLQDEHTQGTRLQRQWRGLSATIEAHEREHQRIYSRALRQIPQALESVRQVPCHLLDQHARVAVNEVVRDIKMASDRLDSITGTGLLAHGARIPGNPLANRQATLTAR